ncbi:unnamed protein product [marine sediment metagenome]|uniref:Uncharacterized protein n=1 Tax=marine sediment metagenome TaxID=412755 RepID=X1AH11_9ZZZZ
MIAVIPILDPHLRVYFLSCLRAGKEQHARRPDISAHGVYTNGLTAGLRRGVDLFDVAERMEYAKGFFGKNHSYLRPRRTDRWFPPGHKVQT